MSATKKVIERLYHINPVDAWEKNVFDLPVEDEFIPHVHNTVRFAIHPTELIRDAIHLQLVVATLPPEFAVRSQERASAAVRLETFLIPHQIAECNDGSEKDPKLMKRNVREFLSQGPNLERVVYGHLAECRDELAMMLGTKTIDPRRSQWSADQLLKIFSDRFAKKISPVDREVANIRSHWLMEAFFRDGVVPHFKESQKNAHEKDLQEDTTEAVRLGTVIAEGHLSAGNIAYQKLKILREKAK